MAQSGYGEIRLFDDFTGPEIQISANMEHASATGALWNIGGDFTVKGANLAEVDAGVVATEDGLNGIVVLTASATADGDSCFVTTETCFKPSVNAPMAVEVRCELAALTAREVFIGFSGSMADEQSNLASGSTSTLTLTESNMVGFFFDDDLTTDVEWHMIHNGGTTTGVTDGLLLNSGVAPVANDMNILRVEVDNNGTARWFIDGVLKKTLKGAVSSTAVLAGCVGVVADGVAVATVTVDYIAVEANRDWTI